MNWDNFFDLLAAVAVIGTAVTGFLIYRKDKRKDDVDADTVQKTTELAADESSVTQALRLRDEALEERREAKAEAIKAKAEADRLVGAAEKRINERIDGVETELRRWRDWAFDIHTRWNYHRTQNEPPPFPKQ